MRRISMGLLVIVEVVVPALDNDVPFKRAANSVAWMRGYGEGSNLTNDDDDGKRGRLGGHIILLLIILLLVE